MRRQNLPLLLPLLLLTACKTDDASKLFTNLPPDRTGLHFSNDLTENEQFNIIKYLYFYNGGGVAIGDVNNDGLPDIFLTANQLPNRLFLNRGGMNFEDVTERAGLLPPEEAGGRWKTGTTMADVNADGWLDIYVCEVGFYKSVNGRNRLFINNKNGTFTERAEEFGLAFKGFSQQAAFFDYDLDGDLDCYLLNHSTHSAESFSPAANRSERDDQAGDRLYRNDFPLQGGRGGFTDVSEQAGIFGGPMGYGLGLAVSDLNSDGWPDIYVTNDFHENDYLYLNSPQSAVLSPQPGNRIFREVIAAATGHTSTFSMGVDAADLNNDGLPDLLTLDMRPDSIAVFRASAGTDHYNLQQMKLQNGYHAQFPVNSLQLAAGSPQSAVGSPKDGEMGCYFSDVANLAGVAATDWSWGPLLADLDNDGWKDIFITNGIWRRPNDLDYLRYASDDEVKRKASDQQLAAKMPSGKVANFAYKQIPSAGGAAGGLSFENTSKPWGLDLHGCSNGAAYADLDLDGDLDLVVNNLNAQASIFQNNSEKKTGHNYLKIKLVGNQHNLFGIGAKVWVTAGGTTQFQELSPTRGWQSSSDHMLVFGVAKNEKIDELRVVWPGGWQQILTNVPANQTLTLQAVDAVELAKSAPAPQPIFTPTPFEGLAHQENRFTDFNVEPLLPWLLSTQGPKLAISANGWLYLCGAKGQAGQLGRFDIPTIVGTRFVKPEQPALDADFLAEDADATFFDADGDGDHDLYVASGGGEYREGAAQLRDRLYLNDGNFLFSRNEAALPDLAVNSSTVVPLDFDGDGDLDIFTGSRSLPGSYGLPPKSFLLKNHFVETGALRFTDATAEACPALAGAGMVTSAVWLQAEKKLITAGEWTGLQVFDFSHPAAGCSQSATPGPDGFWQVLEAADFDADGDLDLLAGNLGQNTPLAASPERPLALFVNDFDENGATDPVMTWHRDGRRYPLATKDALVQQLPFLRKKYVGYRAFAEATFEEIFDSKLLENAAHLQATELRSMYFENQGNGQFRPVPLPLAAQVSSIHAFLPGDFDGDGKMDALAVGNFHGLRPDLGRADASYGYFLKGDGRGNFTVLPPGESGFFVPGEGRDLALLTAADGSQHVIVARNNAAVLVFEKKR